MKDDQDSGFIENLARAAREHEIDACETLPLGMKTRVLAQLKQPTRLLWEPIAMRFALFGFASALLVWIVAPQAFENPSGVSEEPSELAAILFDYHINQSSN